MLISDETVLLWIEILKCISNMEFIIVEITFSSIHHSKQYSVNIGNLSKVQISTMHAVKFIIF